TSDFGLWTLDLSGLELTLRLEKNKILLGETVALEISVTGGSEGLGEPQIALPPELPVHSQSKSQKIEVINWKMTSSVAYTLILGASKPGTYKIGPAKLDAGGGQTIASDAVTLEVANQKSSQIPGTPQGYMRPFNQPNFPRSAQDMLSKEQAPPGPSPSQSQENSQNRQEKIGSGARQQAPPLIFIEAKADKKEAFIGEPIKYTVFFYSQVPFASQPQYVPPNISGFWHEELVQRTGVAETGGASYQVTELPLMLFPTSSGKLQIGSAKIQVEIENPDDTGAADPFDPRFIQRFFGMGATQSHILETKPISIQVNPLPQENKPKDFSGAVGQFAIKADINKTEAKVGESLVLTVSISGNGNIRHLPSPTYPNLEGLFRSYETEKSEMISKDTGLISGTKTYKLLLIPQVPGRPALTIPPIRFVYFDPVAKGYVRRETPEIAVTVSGEPFKQPSLSDTAAKEFTQDIGYIIENPPGPSFLNLIISALSRHWSWPAAGPVALWLATLALQLIQTKRKHIRISLKNQLIQAIEEAQACSRQGDTIKAADMLTEALVKIEDSLAPGSKNAGGSSPSPFETPDQRLTNKLINDLLRKLHFIRFAPGGSEEHRAMLHEALEGSRRLLDNPLINKKQKRNGGATATACFIIFAISLAVKPAAAGAAIGDIWNEGVQNYKNGQYLKAAEIFSQAAQYPRLAPWQAHYNAGNAYYKAENYTEALNHFWNAYMINPKSSLLRQNLKIATARMGDVLTPPGIPEALYRLWSFNTPEEWRLLALVFWCVSSIGWWLLWLKKWPQGAASAIWLRRVSVATAIGFALSLPIAAAKTIIQQRPWIILPGPGLLRTGPSENLPVTTQIPEGRFVYVINQNNDGWIQIETRRERWRGWIRP
ncbi:MAG: BatD family protein, partial [Elusimicrobia bacterium]|nr:BatD family protein [Elusimicrobiota bacterium]